MNKNQCPPAVLIAALVLSIATASLHLPAQSSLSATPTGGQTGSTQGTSPVRTLAHRVDAFAEEDKLNPPASGGIVFVGSSIFDNWKTVTQDMEPMPVLNRAIGGTVTKDQLQYVNQLTLKYKPRVVVYYCGSNDINNDLTADEIFNNFRAFVDAVAAELPGAKVIFVSINRAPQKKARWNVVDETNAKVKAYAGDDARVVYVDVNPALFDSNGDPRLDLYLADQLHFKPAGYVEFTRIIRPVLQAVWSQVASVPSDQ